jgi:predicted PurR-regulated permease PerM
VNDESEPASPRRWKLWAGVAAVVVGAAVAWGWLKPPAEGDGPGEPDAGDGELVSESSGDTGDGIRGGSKPHISTVDNVLGSVQGTRGPIWVRPTILWTVAVVVAAVVALFLLGVLHVVVTYLVLALFFSFAMEPAVNYASSKWHWRRGIATGVLCGLVFLALVLMVVIFIPTVLRGGAAIAERIPGAAQDSSTWVSDHLNLNVSTTSLQNGAQQSAESLSKASTTPLSVLFGFTVSLVGGLFALFTVGMFVFYMVVDAPRFRRGVLSFFNASRQTELLEIWESAIEKTGGYFYSKLLLAGINGGLMFVLLLILGVPGAAALGFFQGVVAAFIPIIGTYIAAAVPLVITFMTNGWQDALILLIYVLIYQQVENYLISPKLQGKTMQLHPAIAFGAALAGGAIGGVLWAFLALPFVATIQASASLWFQRHEVVESELTRVGPPPVVVRKARDGSRRREGNWLGSTRGWIRARLDSARHHGDGASPAPAVTGDTAEHVPLGDA